MQNYAARPPIIAVNKVSPDNHRCSFRHGANTAAALKMEHAESMEHDHFAVFFTTFNKKF